MPIDAATIARIMETARIEEVVSEYVSLKKKGSNLWGLCPFHDERTPSFSVSPSKGIFKCFGCGKGGTAVHFLMEKEGYSYPEALKALAKRYNIEVVETGSIEENKQQQEARESIYVVNEWARDYYQNILFNHIDGRSAGLSYLHSRGFSDETIKKFGLGYALDDWHALSNAAIEKGFSKEALERSTICGKKENGELYDFFRDRVIFPWYSISGRIVAFSGRKLTPATKGVEQKYINSKETLVYTKGNELYGIYQSRAAIKKEGCVYLVEGQTDVISMHQCGIENVVAGSGTALTPQNARVLGQQASNVVMLYDGDEAGIHAAFKNLPILLDRGLHVEMLFFPDGEDPDSFARHHSADEFRTFITENKKDAILFSAQYESDKAGSDPLKRTAAIHTVVNTIAHLQDGVLVSEYVKLVAQIFDKTEAELYRDLSNQRQKVKEERAEVPHNAPIQKEQQQLSSLELREKDILECLLRKGFEKINVEQEDGNEIEVTVSEYIYALLEGITFINETHRQIMNEYVANYTESFDPEKYFINHSNPSIAAIAADIYIERYHLTWGKDPEIKRLKQQQNPTSAEKNRLNALLRQKALDRKIELQKDTEMTVNAYKIERINNRLAEINQELKLENSPEKTKELFAEKIDLTKILREIKYPEEARKRKKEEAEKKKKNGAME